MPTVLGTEIQVRRPAGNGRPEATYRGMVIGADELGRPNMVRVTAVNSQHWQPAFDYCFRPDTEIKNR